MHTHALRTGYIGYTVISYYIESYHIMSHHIISYDIISYHIILYHIISYHIISFHTGVLDVLHAVVDRLPSPASALMDINGPFLGRIVDSW